jgi:hypothetical protein
MATQHTATLVASRTWRASQSPFVSPAFTWPDGAISAELVIASADFTQPTQQATFTLERSLDGGATWAQEAFLVCSGGFNRNGSPATPGIILSPDAIELGAGSQFKLRANMAYSGPNFTGPVVANWWTEP